MSRSTLSQRAANLPYSAAREQEDWLDWMENQQRSAEDLRRVDRAFLGGTLGITLGWLLLGLFSIGTLGGLTAVAVTLVLHHFGTH